jgi:integrase
VRLRWSHLHIAEGFVTVHIQKKSEPIDVPLTAPILDYLTALSAPEDPMAPIFPTAFATYEQKGRVAELSHQFRGILAAAGLAEPFTHLKKEGGRGRDGRREMNEVSFHSLRHSAVSMLKAAGVSDAIVRDIIGHDSEAVSRGYTHLSSDDKKPYLARLPDITKEEGTTDAKPLGRKKKKE